MDVFANNSEPVVTNQINYKTHENKLHGHGICPNYGLCNLAEYNRSDIIHRLKNYFKLMVVRNPFDRLVSGYKDKFSGTNEYFERIIVIPKILPEFRPGFNVSKYIKGATFPEFMKYFTKYGSPRADRHFRSHESHCHPCQIQYDYIAKLETQSRDVHFITNEKLSGRGDTSKQLNRANVMQNNFDGTVIVKDLPLFQNITLKQIATLKELFRHDLSRYGYSVRFTNGSLTAECGADTGCC